MKAMLRAEAFGWGVSRSRRPSAQFDVRRPRVDELIGLTGQSHYLRRHIPYKVDWREMNSTGNRGVFFCWTLTIGCLYEATYRESWERWVTRLVTVNSKGEVVDVDERQVREWLRNVTSALTS